MVEVVARLGVRDGLCVRIGILAFDLEHARAGEPLPIEADGLEEVGEVAAEEGDELCEVGDDEDAFDAVLLQRDNGRRE